MRRAGAVDANQAAIVDGLRRHGIQVRVLSMVGGGCPDLLTCRDGVLRLIEIKDGSKPRSQQQLTRLQQKMTKTWPIHIARDLEEALYYHGVRTGPCSEVEEKARGK